MDTEKKVIILRTNKNETINSEVFLLAESPDNEDMVLLEIIFEDRRIKIENDNFFDALKELRKVLEKENIQILCNGAAKNVFPSSMQFSMGNTRKAYKLSYGKQAKLEDMVDIFEFEEGLEFVSVDEQLQFYNQWINSVMKP